jgi:hypothetical protein
VGRIAAALLLAAATTALLTSPLAELARLKPFWRDEGFEIAESCRHPVLSLLVKGAPLECSPSPLYHIAQRLAVRSMRFDEGIAVGYRAVSLAGAGLLLFLIVTFLFLRLGPPWGLLAAASLASQPLFAHYAAESRSYMSWLLLFALTVWVGAEAASRPWREARGWRFLLAGSSLALSLVALPGAFQAALACALCALAWLRSAQDRADARAALRWALLLGGACLALGLYFGARSTCMDHRAGIYALQWPDRAGRLPAVLSLLWGEGIGGTLANALFLLGLVAALRLRAPRSSATGKPGPGEFGAWLAAFVAAQLGLTLILAAQVILAGYFFVPRIFLHLIVCRALFIAAGGWALARGLEKRVAAPARLAIHTVAFALAVLAVATAFTLEGDTVAGARAMRAPAGGPCQDLDGELAVVVPAGMTDLAQGPNFIVRLGREKRRCGGGPSAEMRHVVAGPPGEIGFRISTDRPPDTVPLEQCGRPVIVGP